MNNCTDKYNTQKYNDIINNKYTGVKKHPRMSMKSRGAQFAPFAALKS